MTVFKNPTTFSKSLVCALVATVLSACGGSDYDTPKPPNPVPVPQPEPQPAQPTSFVLGLLPDTQGGSDASGQAHVAMHPMDEVLKHQADKGVNMVIALGDLTDNGSSIEFAEWVSVAKQYQQQGIEFLPVMGNHETSYAYTLEWIDNMRSFIPEDAVHMPGYEWVNYYVIRENVLIFGLAYYNLPVAYTWIKDIVLSHRDEVDHIVVASHDGLIGAKYGQTLEQIVDGTKDDGWVYDVQPQIRQFFAEQDVIYVQGHEHQYQRSLITAKTTLTTLPSSSTPTGGNYKMGAYTQIMAGNASYKGYEFRFGERELVQMIVAQKNATYDLGKGSTHFDVNSGLLTFKGSRVDYQSYFAPHTAKSNDADQDFTANWQLMDKFSRTTNRCETMIYPNSILHDTRPVLVFQTQYLTNDCYGDDGSFARLVGGRNDTFNRTDTRTRDLSFTPGISRAESLMDLTRLAYQWLFIPHENWTPNLNSPLRVVPDTEANELLIPETSIDLKEHVTLSWLAGESDTASDILIISGTQNQTGIYQGAYGEPKDSQGNGLPMSQTDGGSKGPMPLPLTASAKWDITDAKADRYAVQFTAPDALDVDGLLLAIRQNDGWQAITQADCVVDMAWNEDWLTQAPDRPEQCAGQALVGWDKDHGKRWWVILDRDAELALIKP
ncbi:metallophosphoesterase family protein [Bowmanella denitrificans]|uniref:metallophosphoesterase family protein n=1 Tax=Bowmanella denitrificans TaxID=366582 RepID=UPI001C0EFB12|nr:metallophosphoesterase [Bowmanella denitrificans]